MAAPVQARFFAPGTVVVSAVAVLGLTVLAFRFLLGLGATTNLTNAYPWGIWIAIDVASGVALAAGGFTTAFLAHVVNRGEFHPIVRPALLTAAIGYTFVALGVATDLGRFWAMWHVMLPWMWQPNSVLFEVGICVMCYLTVLYIEFLPIVCERFVGRINLPGPLARFNILLDRVLRILDATLSRVMTVFIILGIILSCMHQSSLGTLMVIAGQKLHPLWQTPWLPLQFLISAFAVGLSMVIFESLIASRSFRLEPERHVLSRLAGYIPILLGIYLAVKFFDLMHRGAIGNLFEGSFESMMYLIEITCGIVVPMVIFMNGRLRQSMRWLFAAAALVVLGVVLNRINVFLIGYSPTIAGDGYVPAWTEIAVTAGFIAIIVLIYRFVVINFPVIEHAVRPHGDHECPQEAAS